MHLYVKYNFEFFKMFNIFTWFRDSDTLPLSPYFQAGLIPLELSLNKQFFLYIAFLST